MDSYELKINGNIIGLFSDYELSYAIEDLCIEIESLKNIELVIEYDGREVTLTNENSFNYRYMILFLLEHVTVMYKQTLMPIDSDCTFLGEYIYQFIITKRWKELMD